MKQVPLVICLLFCLFANAQEGKNYLLTHREQFNKNLKDWLGCFKDLSLNDFKYQSSDTAAMGNVDTDILDEETKFLYKGFLRYSPDKKQVIDLLSGHCVLEKKGKQIVDEGCDHGGYIYIWKLQNKIKYSLPDMGSCSYYEEGFWISNTLFILAQTNRVGDCSNDKYIRPVIFIFNLENKKCIDYDTGKKTYAKLKSYLDLLHKKANVVF